MSSGAPPAAVAVVRISGPAAPSAAAALAGSLPPPRRAGLRTLRAADGSRLDQALVLVFPAPATATGEPLVELQLHGGRAVVAAVLAELGRRPGLRHAAPGEFTRRALTNGRIDLTQAEGLADLLAAESEGARRAALAAADGMVSRRVAAWEARLVALAAQAEALIDFADEDDVAADDDEVARLAAAIAAAARELAAAAASPPTERLHDGIRVVFAGPPNAGKSSLVNALAGREVAIATPVPGTTRDRIEVPVVRNGVAWTLVDVAGLRDATDDPIEVIGIARAREAMASADIVLWLGDSVPPEPAMIPIHSRCDLPGRAFATTGRLAISAATGLGIAALWAMLEDRAALLLPVQGEAAFNRRQLGHLGDAATALAEVPSSDPILLAEHLRAARHALAALSGAEQTESMLDVLFARFCIGK